MVRSTLQKRALWLLSPIRQAKKDGQDFYVSTPQKNSQNMG